MPSPEELAREKIDKLLTECGWILQNRSTINLSAGQGIAIREALLQGRDEVDYLLFVDGKAIGTVEAKPEGHTLTGVETKALNRAVKRNRDRFPKDFVFQLTRSESELLRRQFGTLKGGRGQHRK